MPNKPLTEKQRNAIAEFFQNNAAEDTKDFLNELQDMAVQSELFVERTPAYRSNLLINVRELISLIENISPEMEVCND